MPKQNPSAALTTLSVSFFLSLFLFSSALFAQSETSTADVASDFEKPYAIEVVQGDQVCPSGQVCKLVRGMPFRIQIRTVAREADEYYAAKSIELLSQRSLGSGHKISVFKPRYDKENGLCYVDISRFASSSPNSNLTYLFSNVFLVSESGKKAVPISARERTVRIEYEAPGN
ncbi:MAG: hypothetical protein AAF570_17535 [Bacteroidota bacterium]